jgi:hypothetical protein
MRGMSRLILSVLTLSGGDLADGTAHHSGRGDA